MNLTNIRNRELVHQDWLRALDFYKAEIETLRNRLTEIAGKNTGAEVSKLVEHFENKFTVHKDNMDRLSHDINANATAISHEAESHNGYADNSLVESSEQLKDQYIAEERLVNELRHEFNRFCVDWM